MLHTALQNTSCSPGTVKRRTQRIQPCTRCQEWGFTPANYSLQHQLHSPQAPTSAPSSVLSPSEEKTKTLHHFSFFFFSPPQRRTCQVCIFFPELFPLSDVKSICQTARFHAEMSTLFQQWCPCGCTKGWQQFPGHQRTLCVETLL